MYGSGSTARTDLWPKVRRMVVHQHASSSEPLSRRRRSYALRILMCVLADLCGCTRGGPPTNKSHPLNPLPLPSTDASRGLSEAVFYCWHSSAPVAFRYCIYRNELESCIAAPRALCFTWSVGRQCFPTWNDCNIARSDAMTNTGLEAMSVDVCLDVDR